MMAPRQPATREVAAAVEPRRLSRSRWDGLLRRVLGVTVFCVAAALPLGLASDYWLYLFALVAIYSISVLGLNVLFGITGQITLAQATFMGIGAYVPGIVEMEGRAWSPLQTLLVSLLVAAAASIALAMPALRVSGLRLVLLTLAFGQLFNWAITQFPEKTGGTQGLFVSPIIIGGFDTIEPQNGYLLAVGAAGVITLMVVHLRTTTIGRAMLAVRDSPVAAGLLGFSVV
jgi:branched-chain amino acid transport system permease protein